VKRYRLETMVARLRDEAGPDRPGLTRPESAQATNSASLPKGERGSCSGWTFLTAP
jgi:hypothetical protein